MKNWLTISFILIVLALFGCASTPQIPKTETLFADAAFSPDTNRINIGSVFAMSEKMTQYLASHIAPEVREKGSQKALYDALYSQRQLILEYDSVMTKTAAQTFESKTGNCLSLAIMTSAFANALGLKVEFQSLVVEDAWSRSGDLYISAGHVNVSLDRREINNRAGYSSNPTLVIDFLPPEENAGHRLKVIGQDTILAMYLNNRAAELLVQGKLDEAYWAAREAIKQDSNFIPAYNTLGVIYHKHGNFQQAHQVLNFALGFAQNNTSIISNLVLVYQSMGQLDAASAMNATLKKLQPFPPFHYFRLGQEAMKRNHFLDAKALFSKEIDRDPYYHEFHFWLAQAHFRLGEVKQANTQMAMAHDNSTTHHDRELYSVKLDKLKSIKLQ